VSGAVTIAGRPIGPGHPPYVIAEMSANHLGDLGRAMAIVEAAHRAGADAVKLQTYTADTMTIAHDGPGFRIEGGLWHGRTLHDLYREAHTPWEWHRPLFERGRELGIAVFSSAFDASAVDLLEQLGAPAYKIASFEVVDLPLIRRCAATGKPLVISTGMANFLEIEEALAVARGENAPVVLLHAISGYPTPAAEFNLRRMQRMAEAFRVPVGISDHTLGTTVAVAATALGTAAIEKHLTLARADGGPDGAFSMEPSELVAMVAAVREAYLSLGSGEDRNAASETPNRAFRRSLYAVRDIKMGEPFSSANVRAIRPGFGLHTRHLPLVMARVAACDITRGTPLAWPLIGGPVGRS
jgi:N-acetylneuraminate synthase